ncbi:DsbA family protein [Streptomyces sp. RB17]|uniref:DsbA family protein n=1 Tax=Streptomyces sp. RB17 TaxID=2585197 RepID=UPI001E3A800A|nr:thioredoxin domain-containing protein [Streptomyces sp. RB17]
MMQLKRGGRRLTVAVLTGVLGAAVVSCGPRHPVAAADDGQQTSGKADYARSADVPEQVEPDGTSVLVGDPQARITVHLYEDPRCPYCKQFETSGGGPVLTKWILRRKVKVEYTMASFLDGRLGGNGSKKAVNALRAAVQKGKFAEYHAVLYQNQPSEEVDGFTDARLLQLASKVKGLRSPSFDTAVKSMKYRDFVDSSEKVFDAAGHYNGHAGPGTPTAEVNGYRIPVEYSGLLYKADLFDKYLARVIGAAT